MADALALSAALIRRFEGLRLRPYLCSAGVATIGYGATFYEDGARVAMTDPAITTARADALLDVMIRAKFLPAVVKLCPGADTPERVAALTSFAFNIGTGALRSSSLRRAVNAGDWDEAKAQILRWNKAGGRVVKGLTVRRVAEAALL